MKKILLIISITFLIFQMVVLATLIDIGSPAEDRGAAWGVYTFIDKSNPANESGTITSVEIWANTELSNCEVATFFPEILPAYSTRDSEAVGTVAASSKQTFEVNLDVEAGDYIGLYYTAGKIEGETSGGAGVLYKSGDNIPCEDINFGTWTATGLLSLYGEGATIGVEEEHAILMGTDF